MFRRGWPGTTGAVSVVNIGRAFGLFPFLALLSPQSLSKEGMVSVKFLLSNSRLPSLSAWIFGAFLLAAFDQARVAEGQTVRPLGNRQSSVADQQYLDRCRVHRY